MDEVGQRAAIITYARECVGTPWGHQGRVKGKALDCVGLIRNAAVAAGIVTEDEDFRNYGPAARPDIMQEKLQQYFAEIPHLDALPGDIIWFVVEGSPRHLAVFTGTTVIHAVNKSPMCVVEHSLRSPWTNRIRAVLRFRRFLN